MKALTVGGAMIDTIAIIESERIERVTLRNTAASFLMLEEGRKTEALEISTHCGGGAINSAVALARLGLDVATLVKLGKDARAETILSRLLDEGISSRWVLRDGRSPTGASVHISSHDRNAAIFTFRGANTLLEDEDVRPDAFAVDLVYAASLSGKSADVLPAIVKRGKAQGAMVVVNPGVRQVSDRGGAFQSALPHIDVLVLNRHEANALVPALVRALGETQAPGKVPPVDGRSLAGGGFEMDIPTFVRCVTGLGPRTVVLTDGAAGAYVGTADRLFHCRAIEGEVRGTAGAGDAFGATFAASVLMGRGIEDAVRAAAINAAAVTTFVDTQSGLLTRERLEARVEETRSTVTVSNWPLA